MIRLMKNFWTFLIFNTTLQLLRVKTLPLRVSLSATVTTTKNVFPNNRHLHIVLLFTSLTLPMRKTTDIQILLTLKFRSVRLRIRLQTQPQLRIPITTQAIQALFTQINMTILRLNQVLDFVWLLLFQFWFQNTFFFCDMKIQRSVE